MVTAKSTTGVAKVLGQMGGHVPASGPCHSPAKTRGCGRCPGGSSRDVSHERVVQGVSTSFQAETRRHAGYCHKVECYLLQKGTSQANLSWHGARHQKQYGSVGEQRLKSLK